MRRTQISRRPSKRKQAFDAEYAKVLPGVLARGCEFDAYYDDSYAKPYGPYDLMRCRGPLRGHHAAGRQVRDANDPENLRCLCDQHHIVVHANPSWAREVGLMVSRIS